MSANETKPRSREGRAPPAAAPQRRGLAVNVHHWDFISFLHWPFDPDQIARLLPDDLAVLTFEGRAWVGVTPFFIRVRPPVIPAVPPGWAFPETNLRTYVTGPGGREGVWFLHMEVSAAWFVATMRAFGLPYVRKRMAVTVHQNRIIYESIARTFPSGTGGHTIVVQPGEELRPAEGGNFERFLTARWGAYHRRGPLLYTPVEHPPWTLRTAAVTTCDVDAMFRAAGLPAPPGAPIAHFSPGVKVTVRRPTVV